MKDFGKYNDIELLKLIAKKNKYSERAFAEIYSRYSSNVYAYILRITGNQEDTNDIFQDVFHSFYETVSKKGVHTNTKALLITIARNACLNYKRDYKETQNIDDFNIFAEEKSYEEKELLDLIAASLECLDFEFREVFVLRQYHSLTYKEINEIIDEPISTLKNRFWRAKEKIKEILTPYLEDLTNSNK